MMNGAVRRGISLLDSVLHRKVMTLSKQVEVLQRTIQHRLGSALACGRRAKPLQPLPGLASDSNA